MKRIAQQRTGQPKPSVETYLSAVGVQKPLQTDRMRMQIEEKNNAIMFGSRTISQERDAKSAETRHIGANDTPNASNNSKDLENFTMKVITVQNSVSPLVNRSDVKSQSPKADKKRTGKKN